MFMKVFLYAGIIIFIAIWMILYYMHKYSDLTSISYFYKDPKNFHNSINMKSPIKQLVINTEVVPNDIPQSKQSFFKSKCNINQPSNYTGLIILDWILISDLFSYINYKSFESILHIYPYATYHIHLIVPNTAHYYKVGDFLSKHQFQKYIKFGYHIKMKLLSNEFKINKKHNGIYNKVSIIFIF